MTQQLHEAVRPVFDCLVAAPVERTRREKRTTACMNWECGQGVGVVKRRALLLSASVAAPVKRHNFEP